MENTTKKNGFVSGLGFILAAAGSAIGLGNLWSFPNKTSANGGAAFVLVYVICTILIGAIAMIAEIHIGKRSQSNSVTSYKKINKNLGWFGLIAIGIPFLITCYYSVLGGWTLKFTVNSFQGIEQANNANMFGAFISNPFEPVFYVFIFMLLAAIIIMAGVKNGIEKASKVLMPTLLFILIAIVIIALTLGDGVKEGLSYYLKPDFTALGFEGVLAAMGQSFYSLSIGMGALMCYGSYMGKEMKIGKSCAMICIFDTIIALLAGLAIFPSVFHFATVNGIDTSTLGMGSVGLMYQTLPLVFADLGLFGQVLSFFFFAMVSIAAITSVISLMETCAQFVIQKYKVTRKNATLFICLISFVLSIPITWSVGGAFDGAITVFGFDLLTFLDEASQVVLMPIGAFAVCIATTWLIGKKEKLNDWFSVKHTTTLLKNDGLDLGKFSTVFVVMAKYITPVLILALQIIGITNNIIANINYVYIVAFAGIILALLIVLYFVLYKKTETGENADELQH